MPRECGCGGMSKSTLVQATDERLTRSIRTVTPSSPSRDGSARSHSASSPTSIKAPSVMSPAMPLKGSRRATRIAIKVMHEWRCDASARYDRYRINFNIQADRRKQRSRKRRHLPRAKTSLAIGDAAAGVVDHHLVGSRELAGRRERLTDGERAAAFWRGVYARGAGDARRPLPDRCFRHGDRGAIALVQRTQNEPVA